MLQTLQNLRKRYILLIGVIVGLIAFGAYRFVSYDPEHTHYHANFAVVIDNKKEEFESFSYYEELTGCSIDTAPTAKGRVHMHEPENSVVHVHDEAVTWGHFFENLGYSIGTEHLATADKTFTTDNKSISYILNGKKVIGNPANKEIGDEDRLLVVVGATDEAEAMDLYDVMVPESAHEHNESSDPGTCSSGESHGLMDRFKGVF